MDRTATPFDLITCGTYRSSFFGWNQITAPHCSPRWRDSGWRVSMSRTAKATIHFTDGTKLSLKYPRQVGKNSVGLAEQVRKAIEAQRLLVEVKGTLVVISLHNVRYVEITPAPDSLP